MLRNVLTRPGAPTRRPSTRSKCSTGCSPRPASSARHRAVDMARGRPRSAGRAAETPRTLRRGTAPQLGRAASWNLSSAFVYFVLEAALADGAPGGWWWMSSFGAGFSCHGALLAVAYVLACPTAPAWRASRRNCSTSLPARSARPLARAPICGASIESWALNRYWLARSRRRERAAPRASSSSVRATARSRCGSRAAARAPLARRRAHAARPHAETSRLSTALDRALGWSVDVVAADALGSPSRVRGRVSRSRTCSSITSKARLAALLGGVAQRFEGFCCSEPRRRACRSRAAICLLYRLQ